MFCDQCGTKNRTEAQYCIQCGEKVGVEPGSDGQSYQAESKPSPSATPSQESRNLPPVEPFAQPATTQPTWRKRDAFELLRGTWWFPIIGFALGLVVVIYEGGQNVSFAAWLLTSFNMVFGWGLIVAGILALVVYTSADLARKDKVSVFVAGILWWSLVGLIGLVIILVITFAVIWS